MSAPVIIANGILEELAELVVQFQRAEDDRRFHIDLERWKRRAVKSLSRVVPLEDLERFSRMSIEPNWLAAEYGSDPIMPVLDEHRAYVESLIADMKKNPSSYGEKVVDKAWSTRRKAQGLTTNPLTVPESVTLTWLWRHVPVRLWIVFVAAFFAVFVAGVRIGMIPEVVRWLGPLLGIEVPGLRPE